MAKKKELAPTLEVIPGALLEEDEERQSPTNESEEEEEEEEIDQEPKKEEPKKKEVDPEKQRKIDEYNAKVAAERAAKRGTLQKHKAGARVVDQFGKLEKRRRIVDVGLSDIVLPPFTRKLTATYQIIGSDKISTSTGLPVERKTVSIPGSYMFNDIGEPDPTKRGKLIKHLRRPEIKTDKISNKQYIDDDLLEEIVFIKGIKRVPVESNYLTFIFMELHPLNKSNKFRDKTTAAKFERIDLDQSRSLAFKHAENDLALEAELEVMNKITASDEIIAYAVNADIPVMENGMARPVSVIKHDLRLWARKYPKKFFSIGSNAKAAVKLNALDAIGLGLVEHDPKRRAFISPVTEGVVYTYPVGSEPTSAFVDYLADTEAGQELYEALVNQLDYYK